MSAAGSTSVKYGTLDTEHSESKNNESQHYRKQQFCTVKRLLISLILVAVIAVAVILAVFFLVFQESSDSQHDLAWLNLLSNDFSVEYYVENIYEPRQMEVIANVNGTATIIYTVASDFRSYDDLQPEAGIYALIDYESDAVHDKTLKIFDSNQQYIPTSVQYDRINNYLYITECSVTYKCAISNEDILFQSRTKDIDEYLINDDCVIWFESQYYRTHGWHITKFHPVSNNLCMSFGVPCDSCMEFLFPQGSIVCFNDMDNPSLDNVTIVANGVRDSVGINFHPLTNEMWFTDHNIDILGDDKPDCELNKVTSIGQHFGYPYCHSLGFGDPYLRQYGEVELIVDPAFGPLVNNTCNPEMFTAAIQPLGPHVAPNGLLFYTGNMFDGAAGDVFVYENRAIFVAEHGSGHRSQYIGYRVGVVFLGEDGDVIGHEVFVDGWLHGGEYRGRPSFLAMLPDGSLLVADDMMDAIFRVYVNSDLF